MNKERFDYIRVQSEQGRDVFVRNPGINEEGLVLRCSDSDIVVRTAEGVERNWDYQQAKEISRSKEEWPRRN